MINILIVDDDIDKISFIISTVRKHCTSKIAFLQASNVQEGIEVLQSKNIHLLITDLLMPIRAGEEPNKNGGDTLIKELYRSKNKTNVPMYIVGLSQFEDVKHSYDGVWNVWLYDPSEQSWQIKLRDLIFHIERVKSKIIKERVETIFVEGYTDKEVLLLVLDIFFDQFIDNVEIETRKFGAGASWVERQVIIWAKTLFKKNDIEYLRAIGLFDNDESGIQAIENIGDQISPNSAENSTFSILKLDKKYANHLKNAYSQGIQLPITLEELFSPFCWRFAEQNNWLVSRQLSEKNLRDGKQWDKTNQSLKDHIRSLSLSDDTSLYLFNKISEEHKVKFVNYVKNMPRDEQRQALASFQFLMSDILKKLKILS